MILVTGAGGYIGRRLIQRLLTEGYHVRCLSTSQHARFIPDHPAIEAFVHNDPDSQLWSSLVDGIHTIIHLRSSMWWGRAEDQKAIEIEGTQETHCCSQIGSSWTNHFNQPLKCCTYIWN